MTARTGLLRHTANLIRQGGGSDEWGQATEAMVLSIKCSLRGREVFEKVGSERVGADYYSFEQRIEAEFHYASPVKEGDTLEILEDGRKLRVLGVMDIEGKQRRKKAICKEITG